MNLLIVESLIKAEKKRGPGKTVLGRQRQRETRTHTEREREVKRSKGEERKNKREKKKGGKKDF